MRTNVGLSGSVGSCVTGQSVLWCVRTNVGLSGSVGSCTGDRSERTDCDVLADFTWP